MINALRRLVAEEEGSSVIILAVAFAVLLGFAALAIDAGVLYVEHTRLVRAVDAAALAGAQELPELSRAEAVARDFAEQNGIDTANVAVNFSADKKQITITGNKTVNLHFATAFGINSKMLQSRATARIAPVKRINNLIPLGINENLLPLSSGTEYMLKGGSQDSSPWRGIIEFPGQGNGGSNYRDLVREGFSGTVSIGDLEGKVPGNKSGPTEQGVEDRIDACTNGCTWDNYEPGCPRVALVPIYRDLGGQVQVTGFAAVFLQRVGTDNGKGNDNRVFATFINMTVSGETDDTVANSYLYSVRLSE